MKTSIDLPDDLYRQVKSKSALEGRAVREVATELFSAWIADSSCVHSTSDNQPAPAPVKPTPTPTPTSTCEQWLYTWNELATAVSKATEANGGLVEQLQSDRR